MIIHEKICDCCGKKRDLKSESRFPLMGDGICKWDNDTHKDYHGWITVLGYHFCGECEYAVEALVHNHVTSSKVNEDV